MTYRELHDAMLYQRFEGAQTLDAWLDRNPAEAEWLNDFKARGQPGVAVEPEDRWRLYGLSRVLQGLARSFQPADPDKPDKPDWFRPPVTTEEWCAYAQRLGLAAAVPENFAPFDCEIVGAENSPDPDEPITLTGVHWPCLMLGNLLICRAGVSIKGGRRFFCAKIARSSTLYWSYWRRNRRYEDLSLGWGSNSQWRTSFRRDYRVEGRLYYNVDGEHDLSAVAPTCPAASPAEGYPLTREERIELLTHRCFIITEKQRNDLWPYGDRIVLHA
jgi:hypothetical protein